MEMWSDQEAHKEIWMGRVGTMQVQRLYLYSDIPLQDQRFSSYSNVVRPRGNVQLVRPYDQTVCYQGGATNRAPGVQVNSPRLHTELGSFDRGAQIASLRDELLSLLAS